VIDLWRYNKHTIWALLGPEDGLLAVDGGDAPVYRHRALRQRVGECAPKVRREVDLWLKRQYILDYSVPFTTHYRQNVALNTTTGSLIITLRLS
jgi:hypothetical protein